MNIAFNVPFMTVSRFAEETGLSYSFVSKRAQDGTYPILKKKAKQESTLINIIALTERINAWDKQKEVS
jgi:transcriptional regulator CtsR